MTCSTSRLLPWLLLIVTTTTPAAFESSSSSPFDVTKESIAGLWKFQPLSRFPKEFTTYPKKKSSPHMILMLKEDGSFQQMHTTSSDTNEAWKLFQQQQESFKAILGGTSSTSSNAAATTLRQGVWDYIDGKLLLAADRSKSMPHLSRQQDTLLTGRLKIQNYYYPNKTPKKPSTTISSSSNTYTDEKHATLPPTNTTKNNHPATAQLLFVQGAVQVGTFCYPKRHPSFFEQPMFQSNCQGTFVLQQILNTQSTAAAPQETEKFQSRNFYDKTFLLTARPLQQFNHTTSQIMQVQFHSNNTFSTVAGCGSNILRGKFDIMGPDKDQLYMRVSRFGFGRSVSGSVYSEGRMLSHEDCKTYWGTIRCVKTKQSSSPVSEGDPDLPEESESGTHLEVSGSVLFGSSLEPMPIGRFHMKELKESEIGVVLDEEEEEEEDDEAVLEKIISESETSQEDGIDFSGQGFD